MEADLQIARKDNTELAKALKRQSASTWTGFVSHRSDPALERAVSVVMSNAELVALEKKMHGLRRELVQLKAAVQQDTTTESRTVLSEWLGAWL